MSNPITIPDELLNQFEHLQQSVNLCDRSGRILGRFEPTTDPAEWETSDPEMSDEDIVARMRAETRTYSTAEVLAHLKGLS